jgi:hypothetical protein
MLQFLRPSVSAWCGINALRDKSSILRPQQENPHMIRIVAACCLADHPHPAALWDAVSSHIREDNESSHLVRHRERGAPASWMRRRYNSCEFTRRRWLRGQELVETRPRIRLAALSRKVCERAGAVIKFFRHEGARGA